jgi:glycosyltransferase involved in cell wall biosynthesis
MKVVHVETGLHLYGGAQQVAYLLDGLSRRGIDNHLVCPPGAAIGRHFADSTVRVHELPCSGDADIGFIFRLARLLRRLKPDIVHLHSRRGADVLGGLAARWAGVPSVLSRRVDNAEAAWIARLKYRLYRRVICISQGIADVLLGEGVDPNRLRVVRSAVDATPWTTPETRAAFRAEFDLDAVAEDSLLLGVVAQLIERKGHRILFEALTQRRSTAPIALVVFGQGPLRDALEAQAGELDLPVRFAGFRQDLPRWLGCLDLLIHPALMEGLGVSLLQASAAGVPIIASRAGGMPEAVRDGLNGRLVPPADVEALRNVLDELIDDDAQRQRLAAAGPRLIADAFSTDVMVEGNLAVYREIGGVSSGP